MRKKTALKLSAVFVMPFVPPVARRCTGRRASPPGAWVGEEILKAFYVPVEDHLDPVVLHGIAEDGRALGPVFRSLLGALGREDFQETVESSTFVVASIISFLLLDVSSRSRDFGPDSKLRNS